MTYTIAVRTVKKTPDDGHRNCPKHIEFYSRNEFEKLVNLIGFIVRIYHDARSAERQKRHGICTLEYHSIVTLYRHYVNSCTNGLNRAEILL
jgi:hypothetical protein